MSIKALVIDDDADILSLIADTGTNLSIEVETLNNPPSLKHIDLDSFNLIFLDLVMPQKDGIELLRELAEYRFKGHLVLMSGFDSHVLKTAKNLARARSLNVYDELSKPFRLTQLKDIFTRLKSIKENSMVTAKPKLDLQPEEILSAISNGQIEVHYQPQVDLHTSRLVGIEALVRLKQDDKLIYPDDFIHIAEEWNIIHLLTQTVIEHAFTDFKTLLDIYPKLTLSINLSGLDLTEVIFCDWLGEKAKSFDIAPSKIILEVTETHKIMCMAEALDILTRLRMKGFKVSIDDFGTGNAVLDQIKQLPLTELKIDKSFVMEMLTDKKSEVLVRNTIMMGNELSLDIVAEGIENEIMEQRLMALGCKIGQGYHYSKPLPVSQIFNLVKENSYALETDTVTSADIGEEDAIEVKIKGAKQASSPYPESAFASRKTETPPTVSTAATEAAEAYLSYIIPLTGKFTYIGRSIQLGAQAAYHERFQESDSQKLALEFHDDQSDIQHTIRLVKQLSPKSLAVLQPAFSLSDSETFLDAIKGLNTPIFAPFNSCTGFRKNSAHGVYNLKPGFVEEFELIAQSLTNPEQRVAFMVPSGCLMDTFKAIAQQMPHAHLVEYLVEDLDASINDMRAYDPTHVVYFGTAKSMIRLIEEMNSDNIVYYSTSMVGTTMLKHLLVRKAGTHVYVTEPFPDVSSNSAAAQDFRHMSNQIKQTYGHWEERLINHISFESYLATRLVLSLYQSQPEGFTQQRLTELLEGLIRYDLGIETPLSWSYENRQLLHDVHFQKI